MMIVIIQGVENKTGEDQKNQNEKLEIRRMGK